MSEKLEKHRIYTFLIYPEESVGDYKEIIRDSFIPTLLSPVHSPDQNENWEEGFSEGKKHHHVMVQFDGPKSTDQMQSYIDAFRSLGIACTRAKEVVSKIGLIKYFVHDGWPEKEQFSYDTLICLNGFIYKSEDVVDFAAIVDFVNNMGLLEYSDLVDALRISHPDWLAGVSGSKAHSIIKYLDSKRYKAYLNAKET